MIEPADEDQSGTPTVPSRPLQLAVALVAVEVLVLLGLAVGELLSVDSDRPAVGITTALFFVLYAAGLAVAARGLWRLRSWSRGPLVLAQLIQLGVAWSFYGNSTVWLAVLVALPAAVVLAIIFRPSTTEALYGLPAPADERFRPPSNRER